MRLEIDGDHVRVFLSERNLKSLQAKLDGFPEYSHCTIVYKTADGKTLYVAAETDAVHYANPERDDPTPGKMHPATEHVLHSMTKLPRMLSAEEMRALDQPDSSTFQPCGCPPWATRVARTRRSHEQKR